MDANDCDGVEHSTTESLVYNYKGNSLLKQVECIKRRVEASAKVYDSIELQTLFLEQRLDQHIQHMTRMNKVLDMLADLHWRSSTGTHVRTLILCLQRYRDVLCRTLVGHVEADDHHHQVLSSTIKSDTVTETLRYTLKAKDGESNTETTRLRNKLKKEHKLQDQDFHILAIFGEITGWFCKWKDEATVVTFEIEKRELRHGLEDVVYDEELLRLVLNIVDTVTDIQWGKQAGHREKLDEHKEEQAELREEQYVHRKEQDEHREEPDIHREEQDELRTEQDEHMEDQDGEKQDEHRVEQDEHREEQDEHREEQDENREEQDENREEQDKHREQQNEHREKQDEYMVIQQKDEHIEQKDEHIEQKN